MTYLKTANDTWFYGTLIVDFNILKNKQVYIRDMQMTTQNREYNSCCILYQPFTRGLFYTTANLSSLFPKSVPI